MSSLAKGLTQKYCTALLALHALTGSDTTSAFKGKGKLKTMTLLKGNHSFIETFASFGVSWKVPAHTLAQLEEFNCLVYNRKNFKTVDDLRLSMLKEECGDEEINSSLNVDLSTQPTCRRSLKQHIRRVNFQVATWKRAHIPNPDVPYAAEGHGWENRNGCLQPVCTENED